ncbi:MAG: hypothetical protein ACQESH_01775 [Campylobacterota bacterium]
MSIYYLIDLIFAAIVLFLSYYSYQKRIYLKTFEYLKIFLLITLSASFAAKSGLVLQKYSILSGDTYSVIVLIGFGINILLFILLYLLGKKLFENFITSAKMRTFLAKAVTFVQVLFIFTFSLYIIMQLTFAKTYLQPPLNKTLSYTYIKGFYLSFINDDFVKMIISANSKSAPHEILINSFKNSIN